jgi:hypothetical protein
MKIIKGKTRNRNAGLTDEELTRKDSTKRNAPARRAGITKGKDPDAKIKP